MLQLENLGEVIEGIEAWVTESEELAEATYRGLAIWAFKYVLEGTPEWSGALASQWRLTVGAPAQGYDELAFEAFKKTGWERLRATGKSTPAPFDRRPEHRNLAALEYARGIARENVPYIRLGADTFITNNTPYAAVVQAGGGKNRIRVVNTPILMADAAEAAADAEFEVISEAQALKLAGETL